MVPVGAGGPVQAVAVGHEECAVTAGLGAALGSVAVPAGARPAESQRPGSLRWQGIPVVQDGSLSLSVSVSLYASQKTLKLLPFLSGRRWWTDGLLLSVRVDGWLVQMDGMAGKAGVGALSNEMIGPVLRKAHTWTAPIG